MKKGKFLYIPLVILAIFAFSALAFHYSDLLKNYKFASRSADLPFSYTGEVITITPEAGRAGIQPGDRLEKINGALMKDNEVYRNEISKLRAGEPVSLSMRRKTADGQFQTYETSVMPVEITWNFNNYAQFVVGLLFTYVLPTFCILLGFWVVFARPQDFLAWLLLFVLLGLSSIGLESYSPESFVGAYQDLFFSSWALAMLLFGIYFPERWSIDKKAPYLKWIFIVPLSFQVLITLLSFFKTFLGLDPLAYIRFLTNLYGYVGFYVNLIAIGLFFAALGHKTGTTKNADAKRRLKLMVYGTSIAMMPSFMIVLYRLFSGARGSFFDIVPFWFAILSLLLMLLFPLTMAYVIVVHRALDVRVVVRQGLQYALAKNGVKILQFILLGLLLLGVIWIFRSNSGFSAAQQIAFVAAGFALIPLIDFLAKNLRVWVDRKFFREAYNAEQILTDLSEQVRTMVETKPLLETVSARISESLHVPQVALLLRNGDDFLPAYALGYESAPLVSLDETDRTVEKLKRNETLTVYQDDEESWADEGIQTGEREKLRKLNAQLLLPIGAKNELSGMISLSPKLSEEPFSANDLRLLKSVASQTGLALENSRLTEHIAREAAQKERLSRELEIAREVQERLFPQELPAIEGLDYYGACRPALGVGGDYYDFLELADGKFGFAIGDISGKGIGASLMMASLQASLRGQTIHFKEELAEMMKHINTLLYEASTSNRYATFFYAQYEPKTRKLLYVNAGHNPPFLIRPSAETAAGFEIIKLEAGGAVVGMLPSMLVSYEQGEIELAAGDLIVGFTDGISEAMNPAEEEWGEEAMLAELKKITEKSSAEIIKTIVAKADEFASGAKQHDDMTMIVLKVKNEMGKVKS